MLYLKCHPVSYTRFNTKVLFLFVGTQVSIMHIQVNIFRHFFGSNNLEVNKSLYSKRFLAFPSARRSLLESFKFKQKLLKIRNTYQCS